MSGKKLASVIVDAGGSTTSWGFVYADGTKEFIDTRSYHPVNFNEAFFETSKHFLDRHVTNKVPLFFFGAGMGKAENKHILNQFLQPYFSSITILTDIQGLVLSLEMKSGAIAIMGTGSVLVEIMNGTIRQQIGGLGHLLGDEGSAYFFGSLVVQAYFDQQLTAEQTADLSQYLAIHQTSKEECLNMKYDVAGLAKLLHPDLFEAYHVRNIELFFEKHVDEHIEIDKIAFVGSYAFYKKNLIHNELQKRNIKKATFIQKPIELFCDKFAIF